MVLDSIDFLALAQYLRADAQIDWHQAIPNCKIPNWTRGMQANASFFADIVTLNAALHHCDDMARVLAQAARLVRPGGVLITDEDPVAQTQTYQPEFDEA